MRHMNVASVVHDSSDHTKALVLVGSVELAPTHFSLPRMLLGSAMTSG
jgi:hypothetical protein